MTRIAVLGAGRMGRQLMQAVLSAEDLQLGGVWIRPGATFRPRPEFELPSDAMVSDDLQAVLGSADVAIDFSLPEATSRVLDAAVRLAKPLVSGVSGLSEAQMADMRHAARTIPLLYDRNMSIGVAVLADLVTRAAAMLGKAFAVDIHETHHIHKKDAPSGTAIALGEALAACRGRALADVMRYEAEGEASRRSAADILFSVTRRGEVIGDHSVRFRADAESLELTHRVSDRRVFADGAVQAARWISKQEPGLYGMSDFLTNISA